MNEVTHDLKSSAFLGLEFVAIEIDDPFGDDGRYIKKILNCKKQGTL